MRTCYNMKSITELNGFIYLKGFDIDFSWCENTWNENMQQSRKNSMFDCLVCAILRYCYPIIRQHSAAVALIGSLVHIIVGGSKHDLIRIGIQPSPPPTESAVGYDMVLTGSH